MFLVLHALFRIHVYTRPLEPPDNVVDNILGNCNDIVVDSAVDIDIVDTDTGADTGAGYDFVNNDVDNAVDNVVHVRSRNMMDVVEVDYVNCIVIVVSIVILFVVNYYSIVNDSGEGIVVDLYVVQLSEMQVDFA
jgi:hypothetical protein